MEPKLGIQNLAQFLSFGRHRRNNRSKSWRVFYRSSEGTQNSKSVIQKQHVLFSRLWWHRVHAVQLLHQSCKAKPLQLYREGVLVVTIQRRTISRPPMVRSVPCWQHDSGRTASGQLCFVLTAHVYCIAFYYSTLWSMHFSYLWFSHVGKASKERNILWCWLSAGFVFIN